IPQIISALEKHSPGMFEGHALAAGAAFEVGRLQITALPANHLIARNSDKQALHYLIQTPHGNLLYALDGAWMLKQARLIIDKTRLDMIVWDATMAEQKGDYRIFEHNDLTMIAHMEDALKSTGCIDDKTVRVLDHTARTLWPADLDQARQIASRRDWIFAI